MDYQNITPETVKYMDYLHLCKSLTGQLTPQQRAFVLAKLTEINNNILMGYQSNISNDIGRLGNLNSRKADMSEIRHPAIVHNVSNPLPVDFAVQRPVGPKRYNYIMPQVEDSTIDDIINSLETDDLDDKLNEIASLQQKLKRDQRERRERLIKKKMQ